MRETFITKNVGSAKLQLIDVANAIIEEYEAQGFTLTLRQLYYQFVSRDLIPNTDKSYKRLGIAINDGRLLGMIDWDAIEDRTRNVKKNGHWENPASIVRSCIEAFALDKWASQPNYVEVWIEKEALVGVIKDICEELDVPYFACRGYNSQSEQWRAGKRFEDARSEGRHPIMLHLGDHDPSGIDMTRDNHDRLSQLSWGDVEVRRLALNMDQISQYDPPPNPAKMSDARANDYVERYGYSSWELDALEPAVIVDLIREAVEDVRDDDLWFKGLEMEAKGRRKLHEIEIQLGDEDDDY